MKFPFLENNELILIDYVPGSSGQLLLRLWAELDSKLNYENSKILTDTSITKHIASHEIDYNILIPKRIVNWFLNKCEPSSTFDYAYFFDNLGINLVAQQQKWKHQQNTTNFYATNNVEIKNMRLLYGMHTWGSIIPYEELIKLDYQLRQISIIPKTERGLQYQFNRFNLCYPGREDWISTHINEFNSKLSLNSIDLCTMLVDKNFDDIIAWLHTQIGSTFRFDKIEYCNLILNTYFEKIIKNI